MTPRTLDELVESFALFDDWEEKYRYLIDLGQRLEPMDPVLKTDSHLVRGCTSRVWLVPGITADGRLHFVADSDAQIVRGLIYVLATAYQGRKLSEIGKIDMAAYFEKLGLNRHLSPNRRNGFFAIVERIRSLAA